MKLHLQSPAARRLPVLRVISAWCLSLTPGYVVHPTRNSDETDGRGCVTDSSNGDETSSCTAGKEYNLQDMKRLKECQESKEERVKELAWNAGKLGDKRMDELGGDIAKEQTRWWHRV